MWLAFFSGVEGQHDQPLWGAGMKLRIARQLSSLIFAALLFGFWSTSSSAQQPVQVMVVGTYHMGNPGRDVANVQADDVTQPRRQAELQAVADALATWRPTRILVEQQQPAPFTIPGYRVFTPRDLQTSRNEIVQIGYRLARQLGHTDIYGFDEQPRGNEPDYFQFDRVQAYAAAHGQSGVTDQLRSYFTSFAAEESAAQSRLSVGELLMRNNDPARDRELHARGYYSVLSVGDADDQVGAEFNAFWYMRNAKMFENIAHIARPGDRVLVLVGSGHRYWLTHFAATAPGFTNVEPNAFLRRSLPRPSRR